MTNNLKSFRQMTADDLLSRIFPPREPILLPWLRTGETAIVWAPSGVGKTMLCLSIAAVVAGGGKLCDWAAPSARRVLYLDGEMHAQDVQDRLRVLIEQGGVALSDRQAMGLNLVFLNRQDQDVGTRFFDLTDDDDQTALLTYLVRKKFELVILDNFTTLSEGLDDENDAVAFRRTQDFFMRLKQAGVAAILVHHANKGGLKTAVQKSATVAA
jgi:RecA-family ATPase